MDPKSRIFSVQFGNDSLRGNITIVGQGPLHIVEVMDCHGPWDHEFFTEQGDLKTFGSACQLGKSGWYKVDVSA